MNAQTRIVKTPEIATNNSNEDKKQMRKMLEKQHNFMHTLPSGAARIARMVKNEYDLHFLCQRTPVGKDAKKQVATNKINRLIKELGADFSFIGNRYKVHFARRSYYIDLLFYHRQLRCLIAFEIVTSKFRPEDAGKMSFFLSVLDDTMRVTGDNPSIGIILCPEKDQAQTQQVLQCLNKPVAVTQYTLDGTEPEPETNTNIPRYRKKTVKESSKPKKKTKQNFLTKVFSLQLF